MLRLLVLALFWLFAALCAAGLSISSADDGKPSLPESVTTTLQPGDNRIGWVAEAISTEDLFVRLPQVELVYSWNANLERYEMAAARLPTRLWTLRFMEPGRGYVLRVGGSDAVDWQRSVRPASGLVRLRGGVNWTAWAGRNDSAIADIVKGIGSSLLSIRSGDLVYDHSAPETKDGWPAVQRGDPLDVSVSRDVNWLQPIGVLPEVVFMGDATPALQELVREDLEIVMDHYAREFGVQVDGTDARVYIVEDVDELIAYRGLEDESAEDLRRRWHGAGGWADQDFGVVLQFENWRLPNTDQFEAHGDGTLGRYYLAHELFHRLQHQLSDGSFAPAWLSEGAAVWVDAALRHRESGAAFASILAKRREIALDDGPPLGDPEAAAGIWPYHLGTLAVDRLAQRHGGGALIEFWRSLPARSIGPLGRWRSTPTWDGVFAEVFGVEPDEFYAEFNAWLGRPRDENGGADAELGDVTAPRIEGTVTGPDGAGLPYVNVVALGDAIAHGLSAADGSYSIVVAAAGRYHVYADLNHCTASYHRSGTAGRWSERTSVHVPQARVGGFDMQIPRDWCVAQISGRLLDTNGAAIPGVWISAGGSAGVGGGLSGADGAFTITVPDQDRYKLSVSQFGCILYDTGKVATRNSAASRPIDVSDADITGIEFRLPEDPASVCN